MTGTKRLESSRSLRGNATARVFCGKFVVCYANLQPCAWKLLAVSALGIRLNLTFRFLSFASPDMGLFAPYPRCALLTQGSCEDVHGTGREQ
jgi:hypothetical protein